MCETTNIIQQTKKITEHPECSHVHQAKQTQTEHPEAACTSATCTCTCVPSNTPTMSGLRWRSDLNKLVITSNFEARGWQAARNEDYWDIWWASVSSVQQLFAPNSLAKLRPGQLVNHFPNHYELTHKVGSSALSRCSMCAHHAAVSS